MKITEKNRLVRDLRKHDPLWHVYLTIIAAIILQLSLPESFSAGSRVLLPVLEVIFLLVLASTNSRFLFVKHIIRRINSVFLLVLMAFGNIYALQRVSTELLAGGKISNGHELILAAINIYLTNVIVFALLYWLIDGGGPSLRILKTKRRDFLFTQMSATGFVPATWMPSFIDYLALSGNTALAFSPTDTMPLSAKAKLLMLVQAFVSLVIVGLVAARAVNILG